MKHPCLLNWLPCFIFRVEPDENHHGGEHHKANLKQNDGSNIDSTVYHSLYIVTNYSHFFKHVTYLFCLIT